MRIMSIANYDYLFCFSHKKYIVFSDSGYIILTIETTQTEEKNMTIKFYDVVIKGSNDNWFHGVVASKSEPKFPNGKASLMSNKEYQNAKVNGATLWTPKEVKQWIAVNG